MSSPIVTRLILWSMKFYGLQMSMVTKLLESIGFWTLLIGFWIISTLSKDLFSRILCQRILIFRQKLATKGSGLKSIWWVCAPQWVNKVGCGPTWVDSWLGVYRLVLEPQFNESHGCCSLYSYVLIIVMHNRPV